MHPRKQLRTAIRAALEAAPGLSDIPVFQSWAHSIGSDAVPALGVFTPSENTRGGTGNSVDRTTAVVVIYRANGGDNLDDQIDDISVLIEPVVLEAMQDFQLFGLDTTEIEISGQGEVRTGLLTMTFSATRYTPEGQAG